MEKLIITGGRRLNGAVTVQGAKNGALPILAASVLAHGESTIGNCPMLSDVAASAAILRRLGCRVAVDGHTVSVNTDGVCGCAVEPSLMRQMRSSIVFLGAITARCGEARLSFPGGCDLGPRPIDLHLSALRRLGVQITEERGTLICRVDGRPTGAPITLAIPSVGATENVLITASVAKGRTVLTNAAREPEIVDLCRYLTACGADIHGAGEGVIEINGVERLTAASHTVLPDRIEAATYLAAVAATGGTVVLKRVNPAHLAAVIPVFEEMGCTVSADGDELLLQAPARLRRCRTVRTAPYPGFPTDAAAPLMAAATVADGTSVFIENIFENRYKHTDELCRLGARVKTAGRVAVVEGVTALTGAPVSATDLRGGAALMVAALAADGVTEIDRIAHIDRGYEHPAEKFAALGGDVRRETLHLPADWL